MSELSRHTVERVVHIPSGSVLLTGSLFLPDAPKGLVLFAHGSGSGRRSPRGTQLSEFLTNAGFATLLFDLLTASEQEEDRERTHLRFNIPFLAERIGGGVTWASQNPLTRTLGLGLFGGSTGGAAALHVAADRPLDIQAVVSRGGRTDLVTDRLKEIVTPTLLVVGDQDAPVAAWNRDALAALSGPKELYLVPGATHLFPEPGALLDVARVAIAWFDRHLRPSVLPRPDRPGGRP